MPSRSKQKDAALLDEQRRGALLDVVEKSSSWSCRATHAKDGTWIPTQLVPASISTLIAFDTYVRPG